MEAAQQRLLDAGKLHIGLTPGPPTRARKVLKEGPPPPMPEVPM
jgi:hypothetical protein